MLSNGDGARVMCQILCQAVKGGTPRVVLVRILHEEPYAFMILALKSGGYVQILGFAGDGKLSNGLLR